MSHIELLKFVGTAFNRIGAEWMLTGSVVSNFFGAIRTTHDIDFVLDLRAAQINDLVAAFPPEEFFLQPHTVREAYASGGMFQILHEASGIKLGFWLLKDDPFTLSCFDRRQRRDVEGVSIPLQSPEDCIIQKLWWSKQCGGSEKQLKDVLQVYELQARNLDRAYVERWVRQLGLGEGWNYVLEAAQPLE